LCSSPQKEQGKQIGNSYFLFPIKKATKPSKEIPCNKTGAKLKGISDAYKKAHVRNTKNKGKT